VLNAPDSGVCDVTSHLALTALLTNDPGTRFRWRLYPESLDDHRARAPSVLAEEIGAMLEAPGLSTRRSSPPVFDREQNGQSQSRDAPDQEGQSMYFGMKAPIGVNVSSALLTLARNFRWHFCRCRGKIFNRAGR
jgi:hypothetical protein